MTNNDEKIKCLVFNASNSTTIVVLMTKILSTKVFSKELILFLNYFGVSRSVKYFMFIEENCLVCHFFCLRKNFKKMAEELCQVLGGFTDSSLVAQSEENIKARIEEDKFTFISQLIEILQNSGVPLQIRSTASILLWQQYPEEISDVTGDEEEQRIPTEITQNILQTTFGIITDPQSDSQFVHHCSQLYATCASYAIHIDEDSQPFHTLMQFVAESQDKTLTQRICKVLAILLESYYPEEAEATELLKMILALLSDADLVLSAIDILEKIVEIMTDIFNSDDDDEEGSENKAIMQEVLAALTQLSAPGNFQADVFDCWDKIGKYAPIYLAGVEGDLIPLICEALMATDNKKLLFAACSLLKRITKIEIDDESEELQSIESNYADIVTMLVDVMSGVESPDCVSAETWEPYIAADETLHVVTEIAADLIAENMGEVISGLLQSENFGERDAGLKLIEAIIRSTTAPLEMKEFISAAMELLSDDAQCVKHDALKCVRKGLERIAEENKEDEALAEVAGSADDLAAALDDEAPIASEIALILSLFTEIPNYPKTLETLNLLFEKVLSMDQYESRDIYQSIENICREGGKEAVLEFFPTIMENYQAVWGDEDNIWRSHDFGELLQTYAFRFKDELAEHCEPVGQMLLEAAAAQSDYSCEALLPLSALSTMNHEVFLAMLPNIYQIYEAALGSQNSHQIYCVATGLSLILLQDYPIENPQHWMEILANLLTNDETDMNARAAIVNVLNTFGCKFGAEFHQFAMTIIGYVRTYCQELGLRYNDDKKGHQKLASKVAELLMTTIKNLGEEMNDDIVEMSGELILFFAELDVVEDELMQNMLPLILHLATNFSEFMTQLVENNQEILIKVTSVISDNDFYSKECQDTANSIAQLFSKLIEM